MSCIPPPAGGLLDGRLAQQLRALRVGEDREAPDERLGGLGDGPAGVDAAVRLDLEQQLVVVGALPDAGGAHLVADPQDRREVGVDGDHADRGARTLVLLGRDVAAATADREDHVQARARLERRDLEVRVQDLQVGGRRDVGRGDGAGTHLGQLHLDLAELAVEAAHQLAEVEDDVGDVLADARDGGELVLDPLDPHRGHRRPLEGGQQHAAQAVAEGVSEAAVERLDLEPAQRVADGLVGHAGGLDVEHVTPCSGAGPDRDDSRARHRPRPRHGRGPSPAALPTSSSTPR
jgi:hypothetical protein